MFSALMEMGISAEGITGAGESHLTNKGIQPGLLSFGGSTGGGVGEANSCLPSMGELQIFNS